jgi:hypothetical protein
MEITTDNYFSAASALYWFCNNWHNGQYGILYRVQCELDYHPAMGEESLDGVEYSEDMENPEDKEIYDYLEEKHEEIGYEAIEKFCEEFVVQIHEAYDAAKC